MIVMNIHEYLALIYSGHLHRSTSSLRSQSLTSSLPWLLLRPLTYLNLHLDLAHLAALCVALPRAVPPCMRRKSESYFSIRGPSAGTPHLRSKRASRHSWKQNLRDQGIPHCACQSTVCRYALRHLLRQLQNSLPDGFPTVHETTIQVCLNHYALPPFRQIHLVFVHVEILADPHAISRVTEDASEIIPLWQWRPVPNNCSSVTHPLFNIILTI